MNEPKVNIETLDFDRDSTPVAAENGRIVLSEGHAVEPYVDEADWWVRLPIRIIHSPLTGICLEIGPYSFEANDIRGLDKALAEYRRIVTGRAA